MIINQKTISLLHAFESCELRAYLCPAALKNKAEGKPIFWTIGWGNTYYEDGSKVQKGDVITQQRADQLFENVLNQTANLLRSRLGSTVLTPNQFGAVLSFLYNVGPGNKNKSGLFRLSGATDNPSTLWRFILHNPNDLLIAKQFKAWISPGSGFENGLLRRRNAEVELYFS